MANDIIVLSAEGKTLGSPRRQLQIATTRRQAAAGLIDEFILNGFVLLGFAPLLWDNFPQLPGSTFNAFFEAHGILLPAEMVGLSVGLALYAVLKFFNDVLAGPGQSIGKRLLGIMVVSDLPGYPRATWQVSIGRYGGGRALLFFGFTPILGLVLPLLLMLDSGRTRSGMDYFAKTFVVEVPAKTKN